MSRATSISIAALALVGGAAIARADSIGPCGPGERVVMNDTPPGAMHHGGFHCEPDPSAPPTSTSTSTASSSMCSVAYGAPSGWLLGSLGLAALVLARRRAR